MRGGKYNDLFLQAFLVSLTFIFMYVLLILAESIKLSLFFLVLLCTISFISTSRDYCLFEMNRLLQFSFVSRFKIKKNNC